MENNQENSNNSEFTEEPRYINGKPIFYNTSQVASMLDMTDSAVRYYCTKFKEVLQVETSGKNRKFKEEDIEKLKYIKKLLKDDGLSINQVIEYCAETDPSILEGKIQKQEPLALQTLATALTMEIGSQLEDFKQEITEQIMSEMKAIIIKQFELQEHQKEEINNQISNTINNKFDELKSDLMNRDKDNERKAEDRDVIMINYLKDRLDEQKSLMVENKNSDKDKGLFSRLFKK